MSKVKCIDLKSESGFSVKILNLGGIINEIMAKDSTGKRENVVLNYSEYDDYLSNPLYLGCFIGPVAGRTKEGQMIMDDHVLSLDVSDHPNSLHSCKDGLHNVIWSIKSVTQCQVILTYDSKTIQGNDGELNYQLTYTVSDETLTIDLLATTTVKTYLSLTNHSYFNLTGNPEQTILAHNLKLNCTEFVRLDSENLPIERMPIQVAIPDSNSETHIQSILDLKPNIFSNTAGIDHPFKCESINPFVKLSDPQSGRIMQVTTTQPYVIIYSGNFLHTAQSPSGKQFKQHSGICFETQDLPNIVNNKLDTVHFVTPDSPYVQRTSFSFSTT